MSYHSKPCYILDPCGWCIAKSAFKEACATYSIMFCLIAGFFWDESKVACAIFGLLGLTAAIYSAWRPKNAV